jgi:hypothetical protein
MQHCLIPIKAFLVGTLQHAAMPYNFHAIQEGLALSQHKFRMNEINVACNFIPLQRIRASLLHPQFECSCNLPGR